MDIILVYETEGASSILAKRSIACVAKLVRQHPHKVSMREFESHCKQSLGYGATVAQHALNVKVPGSNPVVPVLRRCACWNRLLSFKIVS